MKRISIRVAAALLMLPMVGLGLVSLGGCGRPAGKDRGFRPGVVEDPLATARDTLSRGADLVGCRTALQQVNAHLAQDTQKRPPTLDDNQLQFLVESLGLDKEEVAEVQNREFTKLDAHYLDQCYLCRDVVRSLEIDGLPSLDRAVALFDWVTRMVAIEERDGPAWPTKFVLRRGFGTPLDRTQVFLDLLQQAGLDAGLVFTPGKDGSPSPWAVGVVMDKDLALFDLRLGLPVPGANDAGVARLSQLVRQPDLVRQLDVDDKAKYDIDTKQVKMAEFHLGFPLSALSSRIAFLERLIDTPRRPRFAIDPAAAWSRVRNQLGEMSSVVRLWRSAGDVVPPSKVLRRFLTPDEGGIDTSQPSLRMRYDFDLVPWQYYPRELAQVLPPEQEIGRIPQQRFGEPFLAFYESQKPRDQILRGRLDEATRVLIEQRDQLAFVKPLDEQQRQRLSAWIEAAREIYAELARAEGARAGSTSPEADALRARTKVLWDEPAKPLYQALQFAALRPTGALVTYHLVLSEHEQAVRLDGRHRRRKNAGTSAEQVTRAWSNAADWWRTFQQQYDGTPTSRHGRRLEAEARAACGDRTTAISLLGEAPGESDDLERLARLVLARRLRTASAAKSESP